MINTNTRSSHTVKNSEQGKKKNIPQFFFRAAIDPLQNPTPPSPTAKNSK